MSPCSVSPISAAIRKRWRNKKAAPREAACYVIPMVRNARRSLVAHGIEPREKHFREAELREVGDAHRIELADQMIAFVLHDTRVKALGEPLDRVAVLVETLVADHREAL